jgi:hypothetical protein
LYWTNIGPDYFDLFGNRYCNIPQPEDKKIKLQDILTSGYTDRKKARCLLESESRPLKNQEKMYYRYKEIGFITIIFNSPDFDYKKGIRYFNQTELERLQTIPDGYTKVVNRNEAASLLGDGWTVDVIAHIFNFLGDKQ